MDSYLNLVLQLESQNTNCIYLFFQQCNEKWKVYEQSAVNLQKLLPELEMECMEEVFPEAELKLNYVSLSFELLNKYSLPQYCTLLGDDYMKLSIPELQ